MTSGVVCGLLPGESGGLSLPRSRSLYGAEAGRGGCWRGGRGLQHILTFLALPRYC